MCLNDGGELLRGVTNAFDRVGDIECLTEFRNRIFNSNLRFFWSGAQERSDVEAGEGFDLITVAFPGMSFRWDWRRLAMIILWVFAQNLICLS